MKRLVAAELNLDAGMHQVLLTSAQRLARNAEDFDHSVRSISLQALTLGQTALQNAVALANRVNNEAVSDDVRARDNSATHDKQMDAASMSERERTIRGGDAGDVVRWSKISSDQTFQEAVEAAVVKALAKAGIKTVVTA